MGVAVVAGLLGLCAAGSLSAQAREGLPQRTDPQRSAAPPSARFEIVQSGIAARITLRLDKYSGDTHQLVHNDDQVLTWRAVLRLEHPGGDSQLADRVNYQVLTSGIVMRYTFLLNVNSGATWQLVEDTTGELVWQPLQ